MDWTGISEYNREILARIVAQLFKLARIVPGERPELDPEAKSDPLMVSLPRCVCKAVMRILVPAEAAMRRLLIVAAHEFGLDLKAPQRHSSSLASAFTRPSQAAKDAPDPARAAAPAMPSFNMFDPLKSFSHYQPFSHDDDGNAYGKRMFPHINSKPLDYSPAGAISLWRRINALHAAVSDLPKAARRYARWASRSHHCRTNGLPCRPRRLDNLRPGYAPGRDKRHKHEVQDVLRDCHLWVMKIQSPPPEPRAKQTWA